MKKLLALLLTCLLTISLCSCSADTQNDSDSISSGDTDSFGAVSYDVVDDESLSVDDSDVNADDENDLRPVSYGNTFYALVLRVTEKTVFAYGLDINGYNDSGLMNLSVDENTVITYNYTEKTLYDIMPGDIIAVTSVGYVLETYPCQYTDIAKIAIRSKAENIPDYDPLYGNLNDVDYSLQGTVWWMYVHNDRCHIGVLDDGAEDYCEVILPEGYVISDLNVGDTYTFLVDKVLSNPRMPKYSLSESSIEG